MALPEGIPIHQYESLPDPCTYIRLLQICSIDETRNVPVHCRHTVWAVDTAPTYTAISYTWGDPNLLELILVDGKKMYVRQNCGYVLRQTWCLKGSGYIWIDAICINQTDNDEKSAQVAMMGSVYQKAVQTLACVGRHEDDSEFLYRILHKKSHQWIQSALSALFNRSRAHVWGRLLRSRTKARLLKAFISFFGRQYFLRVWIYQELFLGRDIRVCCEDESAQMSMFYWLKLTLGQWISHPRSTLRCPSTDRAQWTGQNLRTTAILYVSVLHPREGQSSQPSRFERAGEEDSVHQTRHTESLQVMMIVVSKLLCEDPRDRVYGTRALVDWRGMQPIEPDYNRDRFELALDVLQRIDEPRSLSTWFSGAQLVAENLHIIQEPPEKLNDAIRERLLLKSSNSIITNAQRPTEGYRQEMIGFWGIRLLFNDATWKVSRNTGTSIAGRSELERERVPDKSQGIFPKIQKWSSGNPADWVQADILLPQDAKREDWMLVPSFDMDPSDVPVVQCTAAFTAREGRDRLLHLVDKVLIFSRRFWPNNSAWELFWGEAVRSAKYGVHIDPEDGFLLAHSLNWRMYWRDPVDDAESRRQLAEKYFETKLCGSRSYSYAIPVDI